MDLGVVSAWETSAGVVMDYEVCSGLGAPQVLARGTSRGQTRFFSRGRLLKFILIPPRDP